MSDTYDFDSNDILGDRLGGLSRQELIVLARDLCRELLDSASACHGNIHRGNISLSPEGAARLGPPAGADPESWTSDRLEFMAPELFWDRRGGAEADVYSIGLLLFAGLSEGRLPFNPRGEKELSADERAASLRRRMSGEAFELPAEAGETLGAVMRKCLDFTPEERYADAGELLEALAACPDEEEPCVPPMAVAAAPAPEPSPSPEAPPAEPGYKVDKSFEERVPPKQKKSRKPVLIVFCICAALIILALLIKFMTGQGETYLPTPPSGEPDAVTGIHNTSPSPTVDVSTAEPAVSPTAEPTPSPTAEPTPTPTPTPEAASTYELYIEDVSWTEAAEKCTELGGHLVTISDAAELKKVTDLADAYNVGLVWVGFYRDVNSQLVWVTDESIDYYIWGSGEPSVTDSDGTAENYGLLWKYRGSWIYNDSRNDPAAEFPAVYGGKIAYICEYDA